MNAAIYVDAKQAKEIAQKLRKVSDSTKTEKLGPIDKAEAIRIMAIRGISIESMYYILYMIDIISRITDFDSKYLTLFLIAFSRAFDLTPGPDYERKVDEIFNFYRSAHVSYGDIIRAFMNSSSLVITRKVDPSVYRLLLKESLETVAPEETAVFIKERVKDN